MKIGIIVHSRTGHSLLVAGQIHDYFLAAGHTVSIEKVVASNDNETNINAIMLTSAPKIEDYDMLVFGAPVRGYMLSPIMQAYLNQLPSLKDKIVSGFVTQFFPKPTMGGNQAISRLSEICQSKETEVKKTAIINWLFPFKRKRLIKEAVDKITNIAY